MKKLMFFGLFTCLLAFSGNIFGQILAPSGGGDRNLEDRNVKGRSNELERVKSDATKENGKSKADKNAPPQPDPAAELRFKEVKEDFEKIQNLQNEIVTAYSKSKEIDYAAISGKADEMSKSGERLKVNLFTVPEVKQDAKKSKDKKKTPETPPVEEPKEATETPLPTETRELIVELDNTIAAFVGSPMFTNPQVVDAAANLKSKNDLERLIKLSAALRETAAKPTGK